MDHHSHNSSNRACSDSRLQAQVFLVQHRKRPCLGLRQACLRLGPSLLWVGSGGCSLHSRNSSLSSLSKRTLSMGTPQQGKVAVLYLSSLRWSSRLTKRSSSGTSRLCHSMLTRVRKNCALKTTWAVARGSQVASPIQLYIPARCLGQQVRVSPCASLCYYSLSESGQVCSSRFTCKLPRQLHPSPPTNSRSHDLMRHWIPFVVGTTSSARNVPVQDQHSEPVWVVPLGAHPDLAQVLVLPARLHLEQHKAPLRLGPPPQAPCLGLLRLPPPCSAPSQHPRHHLRCLGPALAQALVRPLAPHNTPWHMSRIVRTGSACHL